MRKVTKPNGVMAGSAEVNAHSYGNQQVSVGPFGLWPDGTVVFKPGGPGFITQDGSLGMKFGWTRAVSGQLKIEGRRLDAPAPPLRAQIGFERLIQIQGLWPAAWCFRRLDVGRSRAASAARASPS